MKHPLAGKNIVFYLAAWAMVSILHVALLYRHYGFSMWIALADSLSFNLMLAVLGSVYWYIVKYPGAPGRSPAGMVFNHALGILVSVSLLVFIRYKLLQQLSGGPRYASFLAEGLPWHIFIGALYITLIILVYYLSFYTYNFKLKEKKELQLQNLLKQSELEMLKFQINPHFIFNSLNSISALTLTAPEQAREMTVKLADFFRLSLGKGNHETHSLREELAQMQLYLEIEKIRFGERLQVETDIIEKCRDMMLPAMILQPLYENAIKHGIYGQLENVTIRTRVRCENGLLHIALSNTAGPEISTNTGQGIGLRNVNSRLELLYGVSGLASIEKPPHEFIVHLKIPQTA